MKLRALFSSVAAASVVAAVVLRASSAQACGGFFCSQAQPVNQAAERILFVQNGNGTTTAVIQIEYEGPSESFSWLLPIPSVPSGKDIGVTSDVAFQRLQSATNPRYNLITRVEGRCRRVRDSSGSDDAIAVTPSTNSAGSGNRGGVVVAASGVIGAFEWTALALDPSLPEPADVAVRWLEEHGYDVSPGSEGLLAPYLNQGLYLLALRLSKGSSVGSIRPIVLTYAGEMPMIPIQLTAVAANDDMGVLAWVAGPARAVPVNYLALELNEARINWFNPASNYGDVVSAAADAAGGQGFVTELAARSFAVANAVWSEADESEWQQLSRYTLDPLEFWSVAAILYGQWDGFEEAARASGFVQEGATSERLRVCPECVYDAARANRTALATVLEAEVLEPVRRFQELLNQQPYITRLYSTLSANEMTRDPLFAFNPDLSEVSNVHTATQVIECNSSVRDDEAHWRIELPQGGILRGTPETNGTWPTATALQAPNRRVYQLPFAGPPSVLEDNSVSIVQGLDAYNASLPPAPRHGCSVAVAGTPRAVSSWASSSAPSWVRLGIAVGVVGLLRRRLRNTNA
jgi:hypothetical protein